MADSQLGEKTEKATPRKKREARKRGEIPSSREVSSVAVLMAGFAILNIMGAGLIGKLTFGMEWMFRRLSVIDVAAVDMKSVLLSGLKFMAWVVGPVIFTIMLTGIGASALQGGVVFAGEPIKPKFNKLSPARGVKRIVSSRSLVELLKGLLKLGIVAAIAYGTARAEWDTFPVLLDKEAGQILGFFGQLAYKLAMRVCVAFIILAALDWVYQKMEHEKRLKMSKHEVKEEFKKTEGDPLIKSRIRSIQMKMARQRMLNDVPKATVVITNPTHYAVALKYDSETMAAPVVVAKGVRFLAQKIKQTAQLHNIPIVENKLLARMLYKTVDVGVPIPFELFKAVAEILAYVYQLRSMAYSK